MKGKYQEQTLPISKLQRKKHKKERDRLTKTKKTTVLNVYRIKKYKMGNQVKTEL